MVLFLKQTWMILWCTDVRNCNTLLEDFSFGDYVVSFIIFFDWCYLEVYFYQALNCLCQIFFMSICLEYLYSSFTLRLCLSLRIKYAVILQQNRICFHIYSVNQWLFVGELRPSMLQDISEQCFLICVEVPLLVLDL